MSTPATGLPAPLAAALFDAAPVLVVALDGDGRVRHGNRMLEQVSGWTLAELSGQRWLDACVPARERDGVAQCLARAFAGEAGGQSIEALATRGGGERAIEWHRQVVDDGDGRALLLSVGSDVTGRDAGASADRLRSILDGLFTFVGLYDLDGNLIEANRAPLDAAGLSRADVIGKPFWDAYWWSYSPDAQAQVRSALARAAGGEIVRGELRVRVGPERFLIMDAMFVPQRTADGEIHGVIGSGVDISERLAAEQARAAADARYRALFEQAGDSIFVSDASGRYLDVNRRACSLLGYRRDELVGRYLHDLMHAADPPPRPDAVGFGESGTRSIERCLRRKDGSLVEVEITVSRMDDGNLLAIVRDASERRRAARELHDHQLQLRETLRISRMGYGVFDVASGTVARSDEAFAIWGRTSAEMPLTFDGWRDTLHPDDRDRAVAEYQAIVAGGSGGELSYRIWRPRGDVRHIAAVLAVERGPDGALLRVRSSVQDVTERVEAEQGRRAMEERFALVFEASSDLQILLAVTDDGRLVVEAINRAMRRFVDARLPGRASEMLGRELVDAMRAGGLPEAYIADRTPEYAEVIRTRRPFHGELRMPTDEGERRVEVSLLPVEGPDGRVAHVLSSGRDVTERYRAEDALRASLAEKETLLREVHHRVKNNLQMVCSLLYLQVASSGARDIKEVLADCEARVRLIASIHEQLYRSSDLSSIDLAEHARALVGDMGRAHSKTQIAIDHDGDLRVELDVAVPIGLILHELVGNALKHAFDDGVGAVTVSLERRGGELSLEVRDNGRGVPDGWRERTAASLGLKLVTALAGQLGGRFELRSDQGTQASLLAPVARPGETAR